MSLRRNSLHQTATLRGLYCACVAGFSLLGPSPFASPTIQAVPSRQAPPPAYLLRYKFRKGETVRYNIRVAVTASLSDAAKQQETAQSTASSGYAVVNVKRGVATVRSQSLHVSGKLASDVSEDFLPQSVTVSATGNVHDAGPPFNNTDASPSQRSPVTETFIPLPAKPVSIGQTWKYASPSLDKSRHNALVRAYLKSVEIVPGDTLANIVVRYEVPVDGYFLKPGINFILQPAHSRPQPLPHVSGDIAVTEEVALSMRQGKIVRKRSTAGGTLVTRTKEQVGTRYVTRITRFQAVMDYNLTDKKRIAVPTRK
jgi:hypothetical protein